MLNVLVLNVLEAGGLKIFTDGKVDVEVIVDVSKMSMPNSRFEIFMLSKIPLRMKSRRST